MDIVNENLTEIVPIKPSTEVAKTNLIHTKQGHQGHAILQIKNEIDFSSETSHLNYEQTRSNDH